MGTWATVDGRAAPLRRRGAGGAAHARHGQALVQFALVIPMFLVLLTAPADRTQIQSVEIYLSDQNGQAIPVGGPNKNVWTRTSSTACAYAGNPLYRVPYTLTSNSYPETSRCNTNGGCAASGGHAVIDTIGVKITYAYPWHTPLRSLLSWVGTGWTLVQSNASRMEPIL